MMCNIISYHAHTESKFETGTICRDETCRVGEKTAHKYL